MIEENIFAIDNILLDILPIENIFIIAVFIHYIWVRSGGVLVLLRFRDHSSCGVCNQKVLNRALPRIIQLALGPAFKNLYCPVHLVGPLAQLLEIWRDERFYQGIFRPGSAGFFLLEKYTEFSSQNSYMKFFVYYKAKLEKRETIHTPPSRYQQKLLFWTYRRAVIVASTPTIRYRSYRPKINTNSCDRTKAFAFSF